MRRGTSSLTRATSPSSCGGRERIRIRLSPTMISEVPCACAGAAPRGGRVSGGDTGAPGRRRRGRRRRGRPPCGPWRRLPGREQGPGQGRGGRRLGRCGGGEGQGCGRGGAGAGFCGGKPRAQSERLWRKTSPSVAKCGRITCGRARVRKRKNADQTTTACACFAGGDKLAGNKGGGGGPGRGRTSGISSTRARKRTMATSLCPSFWLCGGLLGLSWGEKRWRVPIEAGGWMTAVDGAPRSTAQGTGGGGATGPRAR